MSAPAVDHTAGPPAPPAVAIVPEWPPIVLTPRGTAAAHLSRFQDTWAELTAEDRAWFARWLTELLVDACLEAPTA